GTDGGTFTYQRLFVFMFAYNSTSRIGDVGKNHRRPQEHIVFADHAFIDGYIILHFYICSQHHSGRYHYILSNIAAVTDLATRHDMTEMPNLYTLPYFRAFINDGCWMRVISHKIL